MIEYKYWNFNDAPISIIEYKNFLKKYYGESYNKRYERCKWYMGGPGEYKILLAIEDGNIIAQSSAYSVEVIVHGEVTVLWWSIDTFALKDARGKGVGKHLQKKLHEDCINFSSIKYSKINGIIKRKCGSSELFCSPYVFYPISTHFSLIFSALSRKLLKKQLSLIRLKNIYYIINRLLISHPKNIRAEKIPLETLHNELLSHITNTDFYVNRNEPYIRWKYVNNVSITEIRCIKFTSQVENKKCGLIVYTPPVLKNFKGVKVNVIMILDLMVIDTKVLSKKQALQYAINDILKDYNCIDGFYLMDRIGYYPQIPLYKGGITMLSTLKTSVSINNPYISISDQDMDQPDFD